MARVYGVLNEVIVLLTRVGETEGEERRGEGHKDENKYTIYIYLAFPCYLSLRPLEI